MTDPGQDATVDRLLAAVEDAGVGADHPCPICGARNWHPYRHVAMLMEAMGRGEGFGGITLICDHCGFVRLHAAKRWTDSCSPDSFADNWLTVSQPP